MRAQREGPLAKMLAGLFGVTGLIAVAELVGLEAGELDAWLDAGALLEGVLQPLF